MATKNRRRHLRTKAQNLVAHLRVGDRNVLAPVEDISIGGAFLKTAESIAHGTVLAFDIARPGLKRPLRLMGLVVDHRPGRGVGLRFNVHDGETQERLVELLRDLGGVFTTSMTEAPAPQLNIAPAGAPAPPARAPGSSSSMTPPPPTQSGDEAQRLMVQLRGAIMEIGNLQQQLSQKDRELGDLRDKVIRVEGEAKKGGQAETLVGKLEMEKQRLEGQLADAKGRNRAEIDAVKREAESVLGAMGRLVEALKRLG